VGNLSWNATKDELFNLFSKYGNVEDASMPTDRETGRPRGFGFVTMDSDSAQKACADLNGQDFMGRQIRVNEAAPSGKLLDFYLFSKTLKKTEKSLSLWS
jgi:RNA recognition motif-containing protein